MNEFNEEMKVLSEENLEEVAGGKKYPYGPGGEIGWNDERCEHAARWSGVFSDRFQEVPLYRQEEKEQVKRLCAEFRIYVHSEEGFDLNLAKDTYLHIASILTAYSIPPAAAGAWKAFTNAFYDIFR